MVITSYSILVLIIFGLVSTKPIEEKTTTETNSPHIPIEQAFREAEMTLNRYFYLIDSDTDQVAHAMLHLLINNPKSFPFVPYRAMDIAFKNLANKLGQDAVNTLTKALILSIEENAQKNSQQSSFQLTDEVKEKIEDALDKFFDEEEADAKNSHL